MRARDEQPTQLADLLRTVKGKVAFSGYRCVLKDQLYHDWFCYEAPPSGSRAGLNSYTKG